ncbi:hypothetical protein [Thiohalocapsa sp.]|uniref:hypothetical protein n=1 Tax=Thiohalocapsa sp. TaxID=2497641 RepID=UPI0025F31802|nr:hypothetical protein [Thiohalocapsa sp.]
MQRDDEQEGAVRRGRKVYHAQAATLIDYYPSWAEQGGAGAPRYIKGAGVGGVNEIRDRIITQLEQG